MDTLYSFWRSSASFRVRIAANLKQIPYKTQPIHFRKNGGEHRSEAFLSINPQGLLPAWQSGETSLFQSLAIIEYIDGQNSTNKLIPADPVERALVNGMAQLIACDIHPLNNLRVLQYLTNTLGVSEQDKNAWIIHWIKEGFDALEKLAHHHGSDRFCFKNAVSLVDVCLVPQVYNAERFGYDMSAHPKLETITANLRTQKAFDDAKPENQIDAED